MKIHFFCLFLGSGILVWDKKVIKQGQDFLSLRRGVCVYICICVYIKKHKSIYMYVYKIFL